jgi:hypothetical protein
MTSAIKVFVCCSLSAALTAAAAAQSFNIDIGPAGTGPPDGYAAAGQAGHWLSIPCTQGATYSNLIDVNGVQTSVSLYQVGGTATQTVNDPDVTGNDAILMNDFIITFTPTENCLFLSNLQPGAYDVLIYARMPAQPTVFARTRVDQEPGSPGVLVGGPWPGQQQEFISYSHHIAFVTPSGDLGLHAGVAPGGSYAVGAVMNGVQIRKIVPGAGDFNADGDVDLSDWAQFAACLSGPNAASVPSSCAPGNFDGDTDVDLGDVRQFQLSFAP